MSSVTYLAFSNQLLTHLLLIQDKTVIKPILLMLTIFGLSGCSVAPKIEEGPIQYNPEYSYAKNILYASGMPVVPVQRMEDTVITSAQYESFKVETTAFNNAKNSAIIGSTAIALDMYNAVGFVDAGSIFSSSGFHEFVGLGLLKGLLEPAHPMLASHLAIWMPKNMASTEEDMKLKLTEIFTEAHKNSIPEGFTYSEAPLIGVDGKKNFARFSADGGVCDKQFSSKRKNCAGSLKNVITTQELLLDNKYQPGFRPAFFDKPGEEAWVAYVRQGLSVNGITCFMFASAKVSEAEKSACIDYNKAYIKNLKKNLPNWIYFYEFDHEKRIGKVEQAGTGILYPFIVVKDS